MFLNLLFCSHRITLALRAESWPKIAFFQMVFELGMKIHPLASLIPIHTMLMRAASEMISQISSGPLPVTGPYSPWTKYGNFVDNADESWRKVSQFSFRNFCSTYKAFFGFRLPKEIIQTILASGMST